VADGLALHQPEWNAVVEIGVAAEMKVIYERGNRLNLPLKSLPRQGARQPQ
jgi:hypothetical protein